MRKNKSDTVKSLVLSFVFISMLGAAVFMLILSVFSAINLNSQFFDNYLLISELLAAIISSALIGYIAAKLKPRAIISGSIVGLVQGIFIIMIILVFNGFSANVKELLILLISIVISTIFSILRGNFKRSKRRK